MASDQPKRETLAFINPDKAWVIKELDALIVEWRAWQKYIEETEPYACDHQMQNAVSADGEANMKEHRILQEKTLVFLDNNISGHAFIKGHDGTGVDRTDLQLAIRVKHRMDDLDELRACLAYARTPDGQWSSTAKGQRSTVKDRLLSTANEVIANITKEASAFTIAAAKRTLFKKLGMK